MATYHIIQNVTVPTYTRSALELTADAVAKHYGAKPTPLTPAFPKGAFNFVLLKRTIFPDLGKNYNISFIREGKHEVWAQPTSLQRKQADKRPVPLDTTTDAIMGERAQMSLGIPDPHVQYGRQIHLIYEQPGTEIVSFNLPQGYIEAAVRENGQVIAMPKDLKAEAALRAVANDSNSRVQHCHIVFRGRDQFFVEDGTAEQQMIRFLLEYLNLRSKIKKI